MFYLYIAITAVVGYLLGGFNGAIIISKHFYKKDIRKFGSGNAGLTNFYRTFGGTPTFLVLAIDLAKGAASAGVGLILLGGLGASIGLTAVVLGHMFPIYYHFKGGKGILTTAGALAVMDWRVLVLSLAVFIIVAVLTRFVSLGSICAAIAVIITTAIFQRDVAMTIIVSLTAALTIFMHRGNIARLVRRKEPKFSFKK